MSDQEWILLALAEFSEQNGRKDHFLYLRLESQQVWSSGGYPIASKDLQQSPEMQTQDGEDLVLGTPSKPHSC